jgi:rod shape-determining protein MreB
MAAALGEGISVFLSTGIMVVDIGGGTTEIAIIALGGIVVSKSLKLAGDEMDQAILHYARLRHGMLLGERTAENLKISIGSAFLGKTSKEAKAAKGSENERMAIVRGRDIETGLPRSIKMSESEVREALAPVINQIVDGVAQVLEEAPPELIGDILEHGILLTGGGAMLSGMDQLIVERTHMPVVISNDPLTTVVRGTGRVLEDKTILERVKVTSGLK